MRVVRIANSVAGLQTTVGTGMGNIETAIQRAANTQADALRDALRQSSNGDNTGIADALESALDKLSANQEALLSDLTEALNKPGALEDPKKAQKIIDNIAKAMNMDPKAMSADAGVVVKKASFKRWLEK